MPTSADDPQPISRALVLVLAIAVGAAVANIYYVQPLLNVLGDAFGVSETMAGLLVTCAQVGYVAGLALLVPLGDLRERSRLVTTLLLGAAVALAVCAAAPSFGILAAGLIAVGALSCVAQILVPLAATLAGPKERGQVVGTVMSGLLVGILGARIVSGLVAQLGGWRLMFALAAAAMLALSLVLRRVLPRLAAVAPMAYRAALSSVLALIREEPVLRQRMTLGVFQMAGFSVLWTSIAFLLGAAPYRRARRPSRSGCTGRARRSLVARADQEALWKPSMSSSEKNRSWTACRSSVGASSDVTASIASTTFM